MRKYVSMFAMLLFAGDAGAQAPVPPLLHLRPGDLIRLEVPDVAELSAEFTVADDGTVLLPLIGSMMVTGRPFTEVSRDIVKSYTRELIETPVRVTPILRIAVLGEVRQPGLVPADPTYTLADVLAAAGGLTPDGDAGRITLLRDGESTRFSLNDGNVLLARRMMSGDQVMVARRSWIARNSNVLVGAAASALAAAVTSLILK